MDSPSEIQQNFTPKTLYGSYNLENRGKFSHLTKGYPTYIIQNKNDRNIIVHKAEDYNKKKIRISTSLTSSDNNYSKHTLSSSKSRSNNICSSFDGLNTAGDGNTLSLSGLENENCLLDQIQSPSKSVKSNNNRFFDKKVAPLEKELTKKKLKLLVAKEKHNMVIIYWCNIL